MELNRFYFSKEKNMNVIRGEGIRFNHKCFTRCLTYFLGNWLPVSVKWMTVFNLFWWCIIGSNYYSFAILLSPSDINTCVFYHIFLSTLKVMPGNSLVVQRLRLCTSTAGGKGSIPGRGTMIPHAVWRGQNN